MKRDTTQAPAMAEDQAAELAALEAGAAEFTGSQNEPVEPPPEMNLATELAGIAMALVAAIGPMFPSVKALYTEEVTKGAAAAVAGVCVKHGWLSGGLMGEWAEEITCAMVVGPLALATVQGVKADMAAMKKASDKASGKPESGVLGVKTESKASESTLPPVVLQPA